MDKKIVVKIVKSIAVIAGIAISDIIAYFKGRRDTHKEGVKEGKAECDEALEEIIRRYSKQ